MRSDNGNQIETPDAEALLVYLRGEQECLVDTAIQVAKDHDYTPLTTTIRAAWVQAIQSVTECLGEYLAATGHQLNGPMASIDYRSDPRFREIRNLAQQHRSRGITLQMYLGLFKNFRNIYLGILDTPRSYDWSKELRGRVFDFFDGVELSVAADWTEAKDHQRIRELQEWTRNVTLEKDRYFAVFESLRNPAFLLDRSRRLINANQAAAELFLGPAHAGDVVYLRSMRPAKSSLQSVVETILAQKSKNGGAVWLDTLAGLRFYDFRMRDLHDAVENTTLGHVLLLNDVTTYRAATEKAEKAERAMARFLATLSHEIRTPLHSVLGAAELMRNADGRHSETYLGIVESAGRTLLLTLNNVLDYSKFENAPPTPRPVPVKLVSALGEFERVASVWARQRPTPLILDLAKDLPDVINLDWALTQQVLSNLAANAIRHDDGRGVQIIVSALPDHNGHQQLRFEITDHGSGISDENADALFSSFPVIEPRDTGAGGAGLGLAISRQLVETMRGRIGYNNLDQGARFWFDLPYQEIADGVLFSDTNCAEAKPLSAIGKSCLLIDDDPISNIVTADQLAGLGLTIDRATTLAQAKKLLESQQYDYVFVDYILPDGTSSGFIRNARKTATGSLGRIIALTANVEAILTNRDNADVFDVILSKPVDRRTLQTSLLAAPDLQVRSTGRHRNVHLHDLPADTVMAMEAAFQIAWEEFRHQIRAAVKSKDATDLEDTVHRLVGSTSVLGMNELEAKLRSVERLYTNGADPLQILESLAALDCSLETYLFGVPIQERGARQ